MTACKRLGVGVVGAGAPNIATSCHLPAMRAVPEVEVRVLCDLNEAGVRRYAAEYGADWTTSYEEMLAREDVELVQVCTPDPLHCPQMLQALRAGKHVLCQKPLACSLEEMRLLHQEAAANGVYLQAAQNARWTERNRNLKRLIDSGAIGSVAQVSLFTKGSFFSYPAESIYRRPGGPSQFLHNGVHLVDLASWLAGSVPVEVYAQSTRHYPENDQLACNNFTNVSLRFANGALGLVELNQLMVEPKGYPPRERILVAGTQGNLTLDNHADATVECFRDGQLSLETPTNTDVIASFAWMIGDFARRILAGEPPSLPLEESLASVAVCLLAEESARQGVPMAIPTPSAL